MNYPSVKTLSELTETRGQARMLRAIIDGSVDAFATALDSGLFPQTEQYIRSCYHRPPAYLVKLYLADELLGNYGIEYTRAGKGSNSPGFEYSNTGDSYTATIIRLDSGRWIVGCWGDIVERGNYA